MNWPSQSSLLDLVVFVVITACVYAVMLWMMIRTGKFDPTLLWGGLVIALLIPLGWVLVNATERSERASLVAQVSGLAPTYASELERMRHQEIQLQTAPDDPRYLAMIEAQKRWLKLNRSIVDIYTLRKSDPPGQLVLIVDSETDYDRDGKISGRKESRTKIGEVWHIDVDKSPIEQAYAGQICAFDDQVYEDRWGQWVSAYSPMHNDDGQVEALVGVDFPADVWLRELSKARRASIARLAALATLLLAATVVIAVLRVDVAERQRTQVALERAWAQAEAAAAEARRAAEAKGQFLANMSHEIRTPMNGVIGMTELLLRTDLSEEQRQYQTLALESAYTLLDLLNDILDYSKIEAGKLELEQVTIALHDLLSQTMQTMGRRAADKGIELILRIGDRVPHEIIGDPVRLRQVVANLLNNAIKFTHAGEVELSAVVEQRGETSRMLRFALRDTGIGVAEAHREKIFESFNQADASTTRQFGGSGLGLAISTNLVSMMGGKLWLESTLGVGSTFFFVIPLEVPATSKPDQVPAHADLKGLRVLVVDDNQTNRILCSALLRKEGMETESVSGGAEALVKLEKSLAQRKFDVVLLDAMMPGMDGFDVLRKISQHDRLAQTPVILLSSMGAERPADDPSSKLIRRMLLKPTSRDQLLRAIQEVVRPEQQSVEDRQPDFGQTSTPRNVLLAEDSPVNQMVALTLLEDRGHRVTVAANGRAAIEHWRTGKFDVILMDVQMPEVDGFEATRQIRLSPRDQRHRTPIFALTAHAMKGDRERCLEAGMDGYVAKPFGPEELFEAVESVTVDGDVSAPTNTPQPSTPPTKPSGSPRPPDPHAEQPNGDRSAMDPARLFRNAGGDPALVQQLIEMYESESKRQLRELEQAIQARNPKAIQSAAHSMKGTVTIFGADECVDAAAKMERMGRDEQIEAVESVFANLRVELDRLAKQLQDFDPLDVSSNPGVSS